MTKERQQMKAEAKIFYKTYYSHLPTNLPVNYYGLPKDNVYVVYSRFYKKNIDNRSLEFVFARNEEFFFDYKCEKLFMMENSEKMFPIMAEMVDMRDPRIKL